MEVSFRDILDCRTGNLVDLRLLHFVTIRTEGISCEFPYVAPFTVELSDDIPVPG